MKRKISIQLKAAFLLLVFSLNIVVGFACSVGIDMGFNSHHHDEEVSLNNMHHHDEMDSHHDSKNDDGNCCKHKVTKIAATDKALPQSYNALVSPLFFTSFISVFYHADIFSSFSLKENNKHLVRSSPPTIPDIRIAIQSFLI